MVDATARLHDVYRFALERIGSAARDPETLALVAEAFRQADEIEAEERAELQAKQLSIERDAA